MSLLPIDAFRHVFEPLQGLKVGFLRWPGNVGDTLIAIGAYQLFDAYNIEWKNLDSFKDVPENIDIVVCNGGGNMGEIYPGCAELRTHVLQSQKPIVILPQTFSAPEPGAYQQIFVRDRDSLPHCPNGILAPDLALGATCNLKANPQYNTGLFLRKDKEGLFKTTPCLGDPAKMCRFPLEYLDLASKYEHIITDRLHFAISALIVGNKTTLLPNNYHKNKSMYETWLKDLGCGFADTPEEARSKRKLFSFSVFKKRAVHS